MEFEYTAARSIQGSHTIGVSYTVDINLQQLDRVVTRKGPAPLTALDGSQVTVTHRVEASYSIKTDYVDTTTTPAVDDLREMLDSVVGGETWTMDDGSGALNIVLVGNTYKETRNGTMLSYGFKVRLL